MAKPSRQVRRAESLLEIAKRSGDGRAAAAAAEAWKRAIEHGKHEPEELTGHLRRYCDALKVVFDVTGDLNALDALVDVLSDVVLKRLPQHDPAWSTSAGWLGIMLFRRYGIRDDPHDLTAAITCCEESLGAAADGYPVAVARTLVSGYVARFDLAADLDDLNLAVMVGQAMASASRSRSPEMSGLKLMVALAFQLRFQRTGNPQDLDEAVAFGVEGLEGVTPGDLKAARLCAMVGVSLRLRFAQHGDAADLDSAIALFEAAVELVPPGDPQSANRLNDLAIGLGNRFTLTNDPADLARSVETARRAVAAARPADGSIPTYLNTLSVALRETYEVTGERSDLDAAIEALRRAVTAAAEDDPIRSSYLANLCAALVHRYERGGGRTDLEEAVAVGREAVGAVPPSSPGRFGMTSNLSVALSHLYRLTGDPDLLEAAIDAAGAAAQIPAGHTMRAELIANLASRLRDRYHRDGRREDLDGAVTLLREAVTGATAPDLPSLHVNLAVLLSDRWEHAADPADRVEALASFDAAIESPSAQPYLQVVARRAAVRLTEDPGRAAELLEQAVLRLPEVAPQRMVRDDQQHALRRFAGLAADAAALVLDQTGDAARALGLLETGRSVIFSQAIRTRGDLTGLTAHHPGLAAEFVRLRSGLDRGRGRRQAAAELAELTERIRRQPGFDRFGLPPGMGELVAQAEQGPVVTLTSGRGRTDALLLTTDGVRALPLPACPPEVLAERVAVFGQAVVRWSGPGTAERRAAQEDLGGVLAWLWDAVAEPVLDALDLAGPFPRVWWAPGGPLAALPIHAAGHHTDGSGRTVLDQVVSSYTSTIRALAHTRGQRAGVGRAERDLVVSMPIAEGIPGVLEHAAAEAEAIAGLLPRATFLSGRQATPGAVLAALPGSGIAHFACHAALHPDPARSALLLDGGSLAVGDLDPIRLNGATLAYLSACDTAFAIDDTLADEGIHLASAFQLAGFPQVIGTLWSVADHVAAEIARGFYAALPSTHAGASGNASASADGARALHAALLRARDLKPGRPFLWAAHIHAGA
ncbi:CHAT domain-containing protein [Spirillospora sp. NPDC048911]|uniref:CHAT domain-containing protein n=1 Tax=Spirillospora sp. NPDC048911 TaxID=3364527 RepID=UPI00371397EA